MRKIAYSYVRFSRPEQLKGDSLRRQKDASASWCEKNGFTLDDTLRLEDRGLSAFHGDNVLRGKLGAFVEAVENGKVRPGSVLIVESLDRISRQAVGDALTMFMKLLSQGIEIVTLNPEEHFSKESINNTVQLIVAILVLTRAYEESAIKSHRLKQAWMNKRNRLKDGKLLTARTPNWIVKKGNAFEFHPEISKTILRIIQLYLDGRGVVSITRLLNNEKVPTIGKGKQRGKQWSKSTILKILRSRALIGEFQPHLGRSNQDQSKRQPIGEPIQGYYPAIISEADYYRVQKKLDGKAWKGRTGAGSLTNLFQGTLMSADGFPMQIVDKGKNASGKQLVSAKQRETGKEYLAFPYPATEAVLVRFVREIKSSDIAPNKNAEKQNEQLEKLLGKMGDAENRILKIQHQIETGEPDMIESLFPVLQKATKSKKELQEKIDELQAELHSSLPTPDDLGEVTQLLEQDENRYRFRQMFRQLIKNVEMLVLSDGHWRQCVYQIHFYNGKTRHAVANTHRAKLVSAGAIDKTLDITSQDVQESLRKAFQDCKARSVLTTALNLQRSLWGFSDKGIWTIPIPEGKTIKILSPPHKGKTAELLHYGNIVNQATYTIKR